MQVARSHTDAFLLLSETRLSESSVRWRQAHYVRTTATPIAKVLLGTGTRPYLAVRVTGTARVRGSQARGLHD